MAEIITFGFSNMYKDHPIFMEMKGITHETYNGVCHHHPGGRTESVSSEGVDQHSVSDCFLTFSLGRFTLFLSYLFQHIQSLLTLCKEGLRLEAVVQW